MTTKETSPPATSGKLQENLLRIEELTQRMARALAHRRPVRSSLQGPGPDLWARALGGFVAEAMAHPEKLWTAQIDYWGKAVQNAVAAQEAMLSGGGVVHDHTPADPRFSNPLWQTNPWFNALKGQYFAAAEAISKGIGDLEGLSDYDRRRLAYFTGQIVDMMAPTNFLATNPDALEKAIETEGQSLIDGLENLCRDLERNAGELLVTLSDPDAFTVGENLGTTEGAVVFRNRMFELIQYAPTTETVHRTPLLVFPPWINKFYILDLKPDSSLVKWIVAQGYTLFVVSWVNPDESYSDVSLETYVEEGFFAAIEQVKQITGEAELNLVGYCIAGTVLALTLALLAKRGDTSVKSATFLTTLTDFSEKGEVGVFLDDGFLGGLEEEVAEIGVMPSLYMSRTFSYLRANDLIYRPAINAYMLGQRPPAFDLLYWNGDSTNLPGRMAVQYLRGLCQRNEFAGAGPGFRLFDTNLRISDVKLPVCAVACETDHIAAWKSSYRGIRRMGSGDKTFILAQSGHIAGIVNPPSKKKYGHYRNPAWPEDPADWKAGAEFHERETWWFYWNEWLAPRSGKQVPARVPGADGHEILGPAPGTYVTMSPKIGH
ncbi:MAG: class I poly(R)-hydroxyalkanoic acid synthase [Rhodobacterales bacterium]|nr:MAG: class I poly(R)-hydroxyalkanoic acid synthase [Rhodobacterales bacterium]